MGKDRNKQFYIGIFLVLMLIFGAVVLLYYGDIASDAVASVYPAPDAVVTYTGTVGADCGNRLCRNHVCAWFVTHADTVDTSAAPWWLYSDGTLVVGGGIIQWDASINSAISPWDCHSYDIFRIIFTDLIIAESIGGLFAGLPNLTTIEGLDLFDTSDVTSMGWMFHGASSLTSLDLSNFDTGNVENMSRMFAGTSSLTSLDLSGFDTRNVRTMRWMFHEASSLTSLDLSSFDTGSVVDMGGMFEGASSLTSLDLSGFDTSNVINYMHFMFAGTSSLRSLDLSNFDTSSVEDMSEMFEGTNRLRNPEGLIHQ